MLKVEELTEKQLNAMRVMADFPCGMMSCDDCPLSCQYSCGSLLAQAIVRMADKEKVRKK